MAGSDVSRSTVRGLLLMDPRITGVVASGDATYSTSYSQAGEAFDTPVPTVLTDDMVLQSSGTPEVASQSFTVTTQKAGFPGRGKATHLWEKTLAGVTTGPYGWDHPNVVEEWESLAYSDGSTYPGTVREPDAVTLSDGTVLVCCGAEISAGTFGIITYKRTPSTGTWGSPVTVVTGTNDAHPCMVVLPDDRVILFYWTVDSATSTRNVRAYVTADAGATWAIHANYVLEDALSTSTYNFGTRVGRLRACYKNGDIALFGWIEDATPIHYVLQWASGDLGASFQLVTTLSNELYPDCAVSGEFIVLGTIDNDGDQGVIVRRIGTAFQPASEIDAEIDPVAGDDFAVGSGSNAVGDLALWDDEDGTLYVAVLEHQGANREGLLYRSTDAGASWEHVGQSPLGATYGTFYRTADTTPSYPTGIVGTHCRGSQVLLHNWVAVTGDEDNSLAALWLGGYTTLTNPFHVSFKYPAAQVAWTEMWLPYELPTDVSVWTKTTSGGTEALTAGADLITTTAQTLYYSAAPTSTPAQGLIVQFELQCTTGGSTTSEFVAGRVIIGDNTHGFGLSVRCSTTGFRVYDHFAGTALGAGVTSVDLATQWVQFRIYLASPSAGTGAYAVYYRVNATPGGPRVWTLVVSGTGLTDAAALTATAVRFGHLSATTSISRWRQFHYTAGSYTGRITDHAQSGGQDSPDDLNGHDYAPVSVSIADGLKLRAMNGPTFLGSEWTISPRYEYAIEKILPTVEPSPSEGWRSTNDDVQYIDFELSTFGDTEPLNDSIGIYLQGHNFGVGVLQKYDGGAWSTIASFDLLVDTGLFGLTYINNNGACRPGTGTEVGNHYFAFNELVGGVVRFGSTDSRRIVGNTEGFWQAGTSGATKQVTIWYEADGTEPASGTDLSIQTPQALIVAHLAGANYRALRLRISDTYAPPEGYWTLNKCVVGPLVVFGKDSDWARKYGLEPKTTIIENANGNRRSRKMNRPRRSVELPWTEGIDLTQVSGATAASTADYLKGTSTGGGLPIALRNDTAWQLEGVLDYTGGGHIPVVYCPRIAKGTPDSAIYVQRRMSMYGRIVSDWAAEVVVGDEEVDELVRVPGLTIDEEM